MAAKFIKNLNSNQIVKRFYYVMTVQTVRKGEKHSSEFLRWVWFLTPLLMNKFNATGYKSYNA